MGVPVIKVHGDDVVFLCPGCRRHHRLPLRGVPVEHPTWEWNGSLDKPTLRPSIGSNMPSNPHYVPQVSACHTWVTDGRIQFLGDCTHALAGQTVPLPPYPDPIGEDLQD